MQTIDTLWVGGLVATFYPACLTLANNAHVHKNNKALWHVPGIQLSFALG